MSHRKIEIRVCMGTGGISAGAPKVIENFRTHLAEAGIDATVEKNCSIHNVGCRGLCAKDVLVDISVDGAKVIYEYIQPDMVERIVKEHLTGGSPVEEWMVKEDYHNFLKKQVKVVLSDCGVVDPDDLDSYLSVEGYEALKRVISENSPEGVIKTISDSGLRGRGGAGFPTGRKWDTCRKTTSDVKYMICNADEGDPGAFMDRSIIEGNPHLLVEGMVIAAFAVGCSDGYVYIRAEYPLAVERLEKALVDARENNLLGNNILGSGFDSRASAACQGPPRQTPSTWASMASPLC
jgi:NADH-quinone oxidoreductase subunit F